MLQQYPSSPPLPRDVCECVRTTEHYLTLHVIQKNFQNNTSLTLSMRQNGSLGGDILNHRGYQVPGLDITLITKTLFLLIWISRIL